LLWAVFIGWASYDNDGANRTAFMESSASMVFGVVMAWGVAVVVAAEWLPFGAPVSGALAAGFASLLIVLASALPPLSRVPASFYGFASTFAYLTLVDEAATLHRLTTFGWNNGAIAVAVSLLIGTLFGVIHGVLAHALARGPIWPPRRRLHLDGSVVRPSHRGGAQM
jgi:hypothetical protein